ncbi:hypothetical protein C0J52_02083 [Blattella germanica]|nr:hypothetical protein C0J52_02083 [Blattella germanica]
MGIVDSPQEQKEMGNKRNHGLDIELMTLAVSVSNKFNDSKKKKKNCLRRKRREKRRRRRQTDAVTDDVVIEV